MEKELNGIVRLLENQREGWVRRRDAALELGKLAAAAMGALQRHAKDPDVDVQRAVAEALQKLHVPELPGELGAYSLETLARACASKGRREVTPENDEFVVTVNLKQERSQSVRIRIAEVQGGIAVIQVSTRCGKWDAKLQAWALTNNASLCHAAFSMEEVDGEPCLSMIRNIPRNEANPSNVKDAVKEMARYGDWVEKKLGDEDAE